MESFPASLPTCRARGRILDIQITELRYLAVHPEHQRQGVGHALVKAVLDTADELGIDVYIMAYEAGRSVYESLGFREIERHVEDLVNYGGEGDYTAYFMLYEARKKSEVT